MRAIVIAAVAVCLAAGARGQSRANTPEVWLYPPGQNGGRALQDLFERPDAWASTRARVKGLGYADHVLNRQFTDAQLGAWLPRLAKWGLKLSLEVGAVKEWAPTGEKAFAAEAPMWDRFQRLGGRICAIALDEPLCCARKSLHQPDEYAVRETAAFIAAVRKRYPDALIGDVEPYPFIPLDDQIHWVDALEARLKELGVRGQDFYRLDVDWAAINVRGEGSWREVKRLEDHCRARKLPFSLIYWAADEPALQRGGLADDATWYVGIQRQASDYALVGGRPDQIVIESWIDAPARAVPESDPFTFTGSALALIRRLVKP